MKRFRSVVVGTGFIGPVHVEALRRAQVDVVGMIGSSAEKTKAASERLNLPANYLSFDEVLNDKSVDAVHLATPNALHFEQAKAVLRHGKHVLCEKPLAMNSRQSQELTTIARESRLAAGVAYNIRFYPLCHEIAERVAGGSLGRVLHVMGSYTQDWLLYDTDFNWRVLAEDGGDLRAIADIGTHWLDLVQFLTQLKIVAVCATLQTVHATRFRPMGGVETFANTQSDTRLSEPIPISTDDCGCVMLRFSNGAIGTLWVSQVTAGRKNCLRLELGGSDGAVEWNSETPNQLWLGHRKRANECLIRDPSLLHSSAAALCNYPSGHNEGFPDTFKQLFKTFYAYVAANDFSAPAPFPTFLDGHREILLCEAIFRSHREQRWIEVEQCTA